MERKNGFTLIELLAVIVILAVIALIAVPKIFEILNNARLSAAEDSTIGIVESVKNYIADFMLQNDGALPSDGFKFKCNKECTLETNIDGYNKENLLSLSFKGSKPTGGTITVTDSGTNIKVSKLLVNGYICNYPVNDRASCRVAGEEEFDWEPLEAVELGGYHWHVIKETDDAYTLLMDYDQSSEKIYMSHYDSKTNPNYIYSWDTSLIREYLNGEFLDELGKSFDIDRLQEEQICKDPNVIVKDDYSYGGYLKSEIESLGVTCNNDYVTDRVRLLTVSEYYNLSPYYSTVGLPYEGQVGVGNVGKIPKIDSIIRTTDSSWLYLNVKSYSWWLMTVSSEQNMKQQTMLVSTPTGDVRRTNSGAYVRPVITVSKY